MKKAYLFLLVAIAPVLLFLAGVWFGARTQRGIDQVNPWIVVGYSPDQKDAWGTPQSVEMVASNIAPLKFHALDPADLSDKAQ